MAHHSHLKGDSSVIEALDGELMCGVCLQPYERPLLLPCGHNFCTNCIKGIIDNGGEYFHFSFVSVGPPNSFACPICQANLKLQTHNLDSLPVNKALENVVFLYKNYVPTDIFDYAWNTDMRTIRSKCVKHELQHDAYCISCSEVICRKCKEEGHSDKQKENHRINNLQHVVSDYQSKIASLLTVIKKKNILLNERIQLLQDVLTNIEICAYVENCRTKFDKTGPGDLLALSNSQALRLTFTTFAALANNIDSGERALFRALSSESLLSAMKIFSNKQEKVATQLDQQISTILSNIRQQQEELKQFVVNEFNAIGKPISEELKKCKSMKVTMQEQMKTLARVRQTQDVGLRISLMKDNSQYLEKLLHDEIPLVVTGQEIPEVTLPTLELHSQPLLEVIKQLSWTKRVKKRLQPEHLETEKSNLKEDREPVPEKKEPVTEEREIGGQDDTGDKVKAKAESSDNAHVTLCKRSGSKESVHVTKETPLKSFVAEETQDKSSVAKVTQEKSSVAKVSQDKSSVATVTQDKSSVVRVTQDIPSVGKVTPHNSADAKMTKDKSSNMADVTQIETASFDEPDGDMPTFTACGATLTSSVSVEANGSSTNVRYEGLANPSYLTLAEPSDVSRRSQSETSRTNKDVCENQSIVEQTVSHIVHQNKTVRVQENENSPLLKFLTEKKSERNLDIASPDVAEKFFKRGERKLNHSDSPSKDDTCKVRVKTGKPKKTEKQKKSKKSEHGLLKTTDTSSTTTSEALASFVARRRTISPSTSVSQNLYTLSASGDRNRKSDTNTIRQSMSDTKLLSPTLKPVEFHKRVLELDTPTSVKSKKSSSQADNTGKSPIDFQENTTNEELSPKSFLKQPISVNLDFDLDSTPTSTRNVKSHETQI